MLFYLILSSFILPQQFPCPGSFPGVKQLGSELTILPNAEDKKERSCISAPPICLHSVDRENFTFTF